MNAFEIAPGSGLPKDQTKLRNTHGSELLKLVRRKTPWVAVHFPTLILRSLCSAAGPHYDNNSSCQRGYHAG